MENENKNLENNEQKTEKKSILDIFKNKTYLYIAVAALAAVIVAVIVIVVAIGGGNDNGTDGGDIPAGDVGGSGDEGNGDETGNGGDETGTGDETLNLAYNNSLELLNKLLADYNATASEAEMLYVSGGNTFNFDTVSFDSPANFVALENSDYNFNLGYPEADVSKQDDIASMFNALNANTFNCYAVHFTNSNDVDAMAVTLKDNILDRAWECGRPEKLFIVKCPGDYLVVVWGVASYGGIVVPFAESIVENIEGATTVVSTNIDY